ncbi:RNA recognition motif domain-containing protein [Vibrio vulnificus]|uniref:RNA recognition motif domain-containing protein n=1 Tax=Vibrio vulnificus TaxID=672 RepID=UPI0009B64E7A|nr:RNA-binding protein [Vibrio vulnificus]OQK48027.1 RNA-binding protein [Vibrio vulnificus]OQK57861.1 RNA-binding protein [Vibrio vulnificus]POC24979.1 RNA-binding protein [Vibrio vulnificus]
MTFKKVIASAALAILGGFIFSQLDISPAISFVIGVVLTTLLISFFPHTLTVTDSDSSFPTKTLYVGNLPYKANETHVRELFAQHGQVYGVRLMKDKRTGKRRGFGFVVMASGDAENAINALNEKEYAQRTLKVRIANEMKHSIEDKVL